MGLAGKRRIVIIDQSQSMIKDLRNIFHDTGISLFSSRSSYSGIQLIHKIQPALVIVDTIIDDLSGFDVLNYIKKSGFIQNIQVIIFSSVSMHQNELYAQYLNADFYAAKGETSLEELKQLCELAIGNPKQENNQTFTIPSVQEIRNRMTIILDNMLIQNVLNSELFEIAKQLEPLNCIFEDFFDFCLRNFEIKLCSLLHQYPQGLNYYEKSMSYMPKLYRDKNFDKIHTSYYDLNPLETMTMDRNIFDDFEWNYEEGTEDFGTEKTLTLTFGSNKILLSFLYTFSCYDEHELFQQALVHYESILDKALHYNADRQYIHLLKQKFSQFLPEKIIGDMMLKKNVEEMMKGEKRTITAFFSHIQSFSDIEQKNSAESVVQFLNKHFSLCSNVIKRYGGEINKYIDDAIFAMFGAPSSFENNVERAMKAALQLLDEVKVTQTSAGKYSIGIGLHLGSVIIGNIGSKDSFDYTAIGDTINLSARLESLNKYYRTQILVSEDVMLAMEAYSYDYFFREVDTIKVKGKGKATKVFTVIQDSDFSESFLSAYFKGLKMSFLGNWSLAINFFSCALQLYPDDYITQIHLERCRIFQKCPPSKWDGAFKLDFK